jgi:hypothetical protein
LWLLKVGEEDGGTVRGLVFDVVPVDFCCSGLSVKSKSVIGVMMIIAFNFEQVT